MTNAGWREAILEAVRQAERGDAKFLDLMAQLLTEQDQARQRLRDIGFGCIGRPWAGIVEDIEEALA